MQTLGLSNPHERGAVNDRRAVAIANALWFRATAWRALRDGAPKAELPAANARGRHEYGPEGQGGDTERPYQCARRERQHHGQHEAQPGADLLTNFAPHRRSVRLITACVTFTVITVVATRWPITRRPMLFWIPMAATPSMLTPIALAQSGDDAQRGGAIRQFGKWVAADG